MSVYVLVQRGDVAWNFRLVAKDDVAARDAVRDIVVAEHLSPNTTTVELYAVPERLVATYSKPFRRALAERVAA